MRLAVLLAAAVLAQPATAQTRCVTTAEAESMTLVALPQIIRQTGTVCATKLPATSLVRRTTGAFIAKYDAAADGAWPTARGAIAKLADPAVAPLLSSDYARPMLVSIVTPLIVGRIAVQDCGTIDRLVTQLAPLPPANTASVVVTMLQYLKAEQAKGRPVEAPDLPLCPATAAGSAK